MMAAPGRCCFLSPLRLLELYAQSRYLLFMVELSSDVAVFAAVRDVTGTWSVLSPVAHELSGRHGIRRVGVVRECADSSALGLIGDSCDNSCDSRVRSLFLGRAREGRMESARAIRLL
jgi:hypothetical protein